MQNGHPIQAPIHLMEQNMAGHFSYLQRATEGMVVQDRDGCLLVSSGLPCDSFNVLFCRGQPSDTDLRESVGYFQSRQLPSAVWVGLESPAVPLLERLGLRPTEREIGMALEAADFRPCRLLTGLTVERVTNPVRLAHFAGILAGEPPDAAVVCFYEQTCTALLAPDCPMTLLVGYWNDEPVAAAEAFISGEVGGAYGVITRQAYRRRGIGTAMTALAVQKVFESGGQLAVLQASPDGCSLYERLGFRAACEFAVFLLKRAGIEDVFVQFGN